MPQRLGCRVPFTPASFTMGKVARTWDTRQHELRLSVKSVGDEDADAKYKQCCNSFEHRAALASNALVKSRPVRQDFGQRRRLQKPTSVTRYPVRTCIAGQKAKNGHFALCSSRNSLNCRLRRDACPISLSLPSLRGSNWDVRLLEVRLPPALLYPPSPSAPTSTQIDQPPKADEDQRQPTKKPPRRS